MTSPTPVPTEDYTAMYSSIGAAYETAFSSNPNLLNFLHTTLTHLPHNSQVLDLGCGTGRPVASFLASNGHRVLGVDMSETMVQLSREAVPGGVFVVGDMTSFDPVAFLRKKEEGKIEDGGKKEEREGEWEGFDAVFNILSLFVLSRKEIEDLAVKWKSWIKPGGILCICTIPAEDKRARNIQTETQINTAENDGYDSDGLCIQEFPGEFMGHQTKSTLFTREGWRKLLGAQGFEVVSEVNALFKPPKEANSPDEPHYFLIGRRV